MTDTEAVLDQAALDTLREMTGDDPAFIAELIDAFVADSSDQLRTMRQALTDGDGELMRRAAHSLKSNSATFGATDLVGLCQAAEARAKSHDLEGIDVLMTRMCAELERVRHALEPLRVVI